MSELPEALDHALAARYRWTEPKRPVTHGQGRKARMNAIQKATGGGRKEAARAARIPLSTWNDWVAGRRAPSPRNLRKLEAAFSRLVMAPAMAAQITRKGYPTQWAITAVVVADPDSSRYINGHPPGLTKPQAYNLRSPAYRTFNATGVDGRAVVNSWLTSGPDAAAQALKAGIERSYGGPFGFEGDRTVVEFSGRAH